MYIQLYYNLCDEHTHMKGHPHKVKKSIPITMYVGRSSELNSMLVQTHLQVPYHYAQDRASYSSTTCEQLLNFHLAKGHRAWLLWCHL